MNETIHMLKTINDLMIEDEYPVAGPVTPDAMNDLMSKEPPAEWESHKKVVYKDIQKLLSKRPDYAEMFSVMDGFEYNGLNLYNLLQGDDEGMLWSNIFIQNIESRDNDIYIDPDLNDKVVIGGDGISVFAYSFEEDCFEIRDKVATQNLIETYKNFSDFLAEIISTVR